MNPRNLFLVDGIGALLSTFLLSVVLVKIEIYIGIPKNTLYLLASFPFIFAIYDFYCLNQVKSNYECYLTAIAYANVAYCILSIGLAVYHSQTLSFLAWSYIVIEIFIILVLATIEIKTAKKIENNK